MRETKDECCPRFDPEPWQDKEIVWTDKRFLRDRVHSFLHIPLNFGAVMKRSMERLISAGAAPDQPICLTDENSLWGADVYVETAADVPGAEIVALSGTFLARVFEGPYRNAGRWADEMARHVASRGCTLRKLYFYYTTCPRCAKKYGKNYVVLLARV